MSKSSHTHNTNGKSRQAYVGVLLDSARLIEWQVDRCRGRPSICLIFGVSRWGHTSAGAGLVSHKDRSGMVSKRNGKNRTNSGSNKSTQ